MIKDINPTTGENAHFEDFRVSGYSKVDSTERYGKYEGINE